VSDRGGAGAGVAVVSGASRWRSQGGETEATGTV